MSRYEKMNLKHQQEVEEALVQMVLSKRKFYVSNVPRMKINNKSILGDNLVFNELNDNTARGYVRGLAFYTKSGSGQNRKRIYFTNTFSQEGLHIKVTLFSKLPKRVVQLLAITHREVYEFYKKYWMQNG